LLRRSGPGPRGGRRPHELPRPLARDRTTGREDSTASLPARQMAKKIAVYHIRVDDYAVMAAEHDLAGPLLAGRPAGPMLMRSMTRPSPRAAVIETAQVVSDM